MEAYGMLGKSVEVVGRKKKKKIITENKEPRVELTSEGSFEEENKILNTGVDKNTFMATSEIFERTLNGLIVDNDEEVYETLCQVQRKIQAKLSTFKGANVSRCESVNDLLSTGDLSSSRSLASSTLSLCSEKSLSKDIFANKSTYKEFLKKVNCPFCYKAEQDKISLIKHLDENCQPLINNQFEERNFIPFSAFQILPNNTIKCNVCHNSVLKNLKYFFVHHESQFHKFEFAKAERVKKYTQLLFCSCCKILVPNNYTQLNFHLNHKTHKSRSEIAPHSEFYKNVDCVYLKSKKFKCLICQSRSFFSSIKEALLHFGNQNHKNKLVNGMFPKVFCEICKEAINIFVILSHLNSHDHIEKEKSTTLSEWFEMCYYCGFVCSNLRELSIHMKTQCKEITIIREKNLKHGKLCKNDIKNESKEQVNENFILKSNKMPAKGIITGGENTKEDLHIIVKDNSDLLGVYKYFKKFGEISRVEIYKEKNVLIHFQDESAVKDVLLLRDVIHINGVKVEITTDEALAKAGNAVKKLQKEIDSDEEWHESSDESQSDDSESTHELAQRVPNAKLEELFQRVSHHLSNTAKTFDSSVEEKILEDSAEILGPNGVAECSVVGFAGTRLSFPLETVDVYCDMWEEHSAMNPYNFNEKLIRELYLKFRTSKWRVASYRVDSSFPYIECIHLATKKSCRFIVTPSAKYLTYLLSYCIGEIDFAKNFCMVVRFWFAVHKLKIGQLDFVIISLLVFFLMSTYVSAENVFEVCNVPNPVLLFSAKFIEYKGTIQSKGRTSKLCGKESNVLKVFQQFLSFLCKFNFTRNMIVMPLTFEVPRKVIDNEAFDFFFKSFDLEELRDSAMCIMDLQRSVNLAKDINQDDLKSLLEAARNTLKNTC